MKKLLATLATIFALIAIPIGTGSAYPGGGHGGHGGGNGGGNRGGNGGNRSANTGGGNTGSHPSNSNGHPNSKNKSLTPNNSGTNSSNKNHSNNSNSNGHGNNNSGHYHYTHQHGHPWNQNEWTHAWNRHWYHSQFIWWNGGWIWWDPDVSNWIPYVEGRYIPEDYYVQGDEPPAAGGGAIRIINPTDTQTTINYSINSYDYQIAPGSNQDLSADQQWVIDFNRGENDGDAEYTLSPGEYTFGPSDHGWELYHTSDTVPD